VIAGILVWIEIYVLVQICQRVRKASAKAPNNSPATGRKE
jgi:hypothetical protein